MQEKLYIFFLICYPKFVQAISFRSLPSVRNSVLYFSRQIPKWSSKIQSFNEFFLICFAGAILNSSMLAASAVHPASETAQIKGRLEVHLEMNTDKHEMTMGLFIKACINATCLFRKKVFDATTIPGKNRFELKKTTVEL